MIYWHTARQTRIALGQLRFEEFPWREKLELALFHCRLFALRATNLGRSPELFESITGRRPARDEMLLRTVRGKNGYASLESLEVLGPQYAAPRRKFEKAKRHMKRYGRSDPNE